MLQTVKERLILYLKAKGLSQGKFERMCGLSNGYVNNLKRSVTAEKLASISAACSDLNTNWLLTGEGDMLKANAPVMNQTQSEAEATSTEGYWVPLVPTFALANSLSEYIGQGVRLADCKNILSPVPGADFAITISGDSMEPKFHDGMVVFLKKINDAAFIPWGNTLVLDTENGAFIKDVFPVQDDDSLIEARSLNPLYPPLTIPKSSIFGMYRVLNATKFFTTM